MSDGQFSAALNKSSRGIASSRFKNVRIGSFKIAKNPVDDTWYLVINQTQYVGKDLPSQDHAISLLHGIFTGKGASTAGMNATIAAMIADGSGELQSTVVIGSQGISSTGIGGAVGALAANQTVGSNVFDQMGLRQINTVNNTSVTIYFWTAFARDKFKELTVFGIGSDTFDPSAVTMTELNADATLGFGLIYSNATLGTAWTTALNTGSVTVRYSTPPAETMEVIQIVHWVDFNTSSKTATVTSTPVDNQVNVIDASAATSLGVGKVSSMAPRLYNGTAANAYGASNKVFQELSGGNNTSDNRQSGYFWSKWRVQMSEPAATVSTTFNWATSNSPDYESAQPSYNNWSGGTAATWHYLSTGDDVTFKIFNAAPMNNRRLIFTTASSHGSSLTGLVHLTGTTDLTPTDGEVLSSPTTTMNLGFSATNKRDGLKKWLDENGKAELWAYGGSKITDLTHSTDGSFDLHLLRDDGSSFDTSTQYELRFT